MAHDPSTWHVQDWLLVVEALARVTHPDDESAAAEARWTLIERLCAGCGVDPAAYVFAIDDDWGPRRAAAERTEPPAGLAESLDAAEWQRAADALVSFVDEPADDGGDSASTPRARRAAALAEVIERYEPSVSLPSA